jgi:hypothetical protein
MPTLFRLVGLAEATVDREKHDVNFVLKVSDGRGLAFVAEAPAARQIAASLGRMAVEAGQTAPMTLAAEKIAKYGVKRDAFGGVVLLQLISDDGIPYMFALPSSAASDIATTLQSESAKVSGIGHA